MIYLDNASTSPLCDSARRAMTEAMDVFANPSSTHSAGIEAKRLLESSRRTVAAAMGCSEGQVIFTGSGSEGNNQAIRAAMSLRLHSPKRIITTDSEHPSVYETIRALDGVEAVYIPTAGGELDMERLNAELKNGCALVSIMHANNETGAVYDIPAVRKAIDASGTRALLHCDDVQGFLKAKSVTRLCDFVTVSAHKIGGPKGCGALMARPTKVIPLIYGGGQEGGRRSGTENTLCIAGFAAACREWQEDKSRVPRIASICDLAAEKIKEKCGDKVLIHRPTVGIGSILSVSIDARMGGRKAGSEVMLNRLSALGFAVSAGSACHASRIDRRVLKAFGLSDAEADSTLRISFGYQNTSEEASALADAIASLTNGNTL